MTTSFTIPEGTMLSAPSCEERGVPTDQALLTSTSALRLPGISTEYLARARVEHVDEGTAQRRCGLSEPGIFIPYFNFHGEPIEELGKHFGRLRLEVPVGGQKYHQLKGTAPHAYLPPLTRDGGTIGPVIYLVEGEKKALSLSEAGYCVAGLGGFFNFKTAGGNLVGEIKDLISYCHGDPQLRFLGDTDVLYNNQFCHAACGLRALLPNLSISCLPPDAPDKGVDDCREILGKGFADWFAGAVTYLPIEPGREPASYSVALVEQYLDRLVSLPEEGRRDAVDGLALLASSLSAHPLEQEHLMQIAEKKFNTKRVIINKLVKAHRQKQDRDRREEELYSEDRTVINLSNDAGEWTRQVLEQMGPKTYVFAGKLSEVHDGNFQAFTAAALVSYLERPGFFRFVREGRSGEQVRCNLKECDTHVLLGAVTGRNADLMRPVEVMIPTPALVWDGSHAVLVRGYSAEQKILAPDGEVVLRSPAAAVDELRGLLRDFWFPTEGDLGRAIAMLLTPTLVRGGFLRKGRSPFFFVEKDQHGAGGSTLARLVPTCYTTRPCAITPQDPKAARDDLSRHLLDGANLICFDNVYGKALTKLDFLESFLTEPEFTARAPYLHGNVNVERCVVMGTSNGAVLSPDLADRTVRIALQKQPDGYHYHPWPERDLLEHVRANTTRYLENLYSLVYDWAQQGRPDGPDLIGFRFPAWEKACSWILRKHFDLPLLDTSHKAAQQRMASEHHHLLRILFRRVTERRPGWHTAGSLAAMAIEMNLMPGAEGQGATMKMGRVLASELTQDSGPYASEFLYIRKTERDKETNYEPQKMYFVTRDDQAPPILRGDR